MLRANKNFHAEDVLIQSDFSHACRCERDADNAPLKDDATTTMMPTPRRPSTKKIKPCSRQRRCQWLTQPLTWVSLLAVVFFGWLPSTGCFSSVGVHPTTTKPRLEKNGSRPGPTTEPNRVDGATNSLSDPVTNTAITPLPDRRPYEQRTKDPRPARRLNHAFRYLYRSDNDLYQNMTAMDYLSQFYTPSEILEMNRSFPPLLNINVSRHLHPKVRFLKETILKPGQRKDNGNSANGVQHDDEWKISALDIPPQYYGARLERTVAPRHAFLVHMGLPHGRELLLPHDDGRGGRSRPWTDFLVSCRKAKRFCALCNQWKTEQQQQQQQQGVITTQQIEAFDSLFGRGLLSAARGELAMHNNTWKLEQKLNVSAADMVRLLIQHGANPLERDFRGVSLLHWAAGTGNLDVVQELLPHFDDGLTSRTKRDGATLLHWGAAGANSKEFGTGGYVHVCEYLLTECDRQFRSGSATRSRSRSRTVSAKDLVNQVTKDGNSPLMWAAWSGSLDTVKLLVRHCADTTIANRNGCTVAHWAASGGNLQVCQYLGEAAGVDFFEPNHGGNTPLAHAVAFGRVDVVEWIRRRRAELQGNNDRSIDADLIAARLAADFVGWNSDGDASATRKRRQILQLFQDDFWKDDTVEQEDDEARLSLDEALLSELEEY